MLCASAFLLISILLSYPGLSDENHVQRSAPKRTQTNVRDVTLNKVYPVPNGQARQLATLLKQIYEGVPGFRVVVVRPDAIQVWGSPTIHHELRLPDCPKDTRVVALISVKQINVQTLATVLKFVLPSPTNVAANEKRQAILVKSNQREISQIRSYLTLLNGMCTAIN